MDFTYLILWLITTAAFILTSFLGARVIPFLRERGFYEFTSRTVRAAATYFLEGQGREKFDWVFDRINERYGKYFSVDRVKAAIQAAYVDMCADLGKIPSPAAESPEEKQEG